MANKARREFFNADAFVVAKTGDREWRIQPKAE